MRIRTRSIIVISSQALASLAGLAQKMVLVRILGQTLTGKEIIGSMDQVWAWFALLVGVFGLQLDSSLYYFLPRSGKEKHGSLLLQTVLGSLLIAALTGAGMFLLSDYVGSLYPKFQGLSRLIRIFSLYPFVDRLLALLPSFFISQDRAARSAVYSVLIAFARVASIVTVFAMGYDLAAALWAVVATGAVIAVIGFVDMAGMCPWPWRIDFRLVLEQLHYVWPLWATTAVAIANSQLDKFLVSFSGPSALAIYGCGAMEVPLVGVITVSLNSAIMPELVSMSSQGRVADSFGLWNEATRKASLVIFPCFFLFMLVAPDLMVLLYTRDFEMASWPFRIYLCLLPLRVAFYSTVFRAMGKTKPIAIAAVLALLLNLALGIVVTFAGAKIFPFLSFVGPSIGAVASTVLLNGYLVSRMSKMSGLPLGKVMRWKELFLLLLLSATCGLVVMVVPLPHLPLLIKMVVQGLIYLGSFLFMLWWTRLLTPDERHMLMLPVRWVLPTRKVHADANQLS